MTQCITNISVRRYIGAIRCTTIHVWQRNVWQRNVWQVHYNTCMAMQCMAPVQVFSAESKIQNPNSQIWLLRKRLRFFLSNFSTFLFLFFIFIFHCGAERPAFFISTFIQPFLN